MPTYQPTKPADTDFLAQSAGDIRGNFTQANTVYGTDHYAFDNVSSNQGFHNTVTTPLVVGSAHPATAANIPKIYAMQDLAAFGVLQYSRGGNNASPTPLTNINSGAAFALNATIAILDISGVTACILEGYAIGVQGQTRGTQATFIYDGSLQMSTVTNINGTALQFSVAGTIISLTGTACTNVYWTIKPIRIVV